MADYESQPSQPILEQAQVLDDGLGVLGEAYVNLVKKMLHGAATSTSWHLETVVKDLSELAVQATGADVAYVRRTVGDEWLELLGDDGGLHWRVPDGDRWGKIPRRKHVNDCFNGDPADQFVLETLGKTACHSRDYSKYPAQGIYSEDEIRYLSGLGSVATARLGQPEQGPPRFLLFLGHRDAKFLADGSHAHRKLTQIQPLLDAAFRLAEGVQDRFDKAQRLKNLTEALPPLALAPTGKAFWRGVATILTAGNGFRFDRAMIFLWRGGTDIAECCMAVGGMGGDWSERRKQVREAFDGCTLLDYVTDALDFPEPGSGRCKLVDPLFREICEEKQLVFNRSASSELSKWLNFVEKEEKPGLAAKPAKLLSSKDDSWIEAIAVAQPGVFFNHKHETWPYDEYFAFPLVALDARGERRKIGFILADVCYAPGGHVPGMDMPDLEITATVLHLMAGMWLARQQEEAYTHTLGAMYALRHHGGKVSLSLDNLVSSLPDAVKKNPHIEGVLQELRESGSELGRAKHIVGGIEDQRLNAGPQTDPKAVIIDAAEAARRAYPHLTVSTVDNPPPIAALVSSAWNGEFVKIPSESLRKILDCILDNAAEFAINGEGARVCVTLRLVEVPEQGKTLPSKRILISLENDGPSIASELAPFLFLDGVSTCSTEGHGNGLPTARQIAKAYRGDVMLLNRDPVTFCMVFPIDARARSDHSDQQGRTPPCA